MDKHYHIWVRSGRIFMFRAKPYKSRAHASKVAAKLRADPDDRMVRACMKCPESRKSRRLPPRWPRVATAMAETLGADPGKVRRALVAALKHERDHRHPLEEASPGNGTASSSDSPASMNGVAALDRDRMVAEP